MIVPSATVANLEQTISFPALRKGRASEPASASEEQESRGRGPLARDWAGAKPSRHKAGHIRVRIGAGNHREQCSVPAFPVYGVRA